METLINFTGGPDTFEQRLNYIVSIVLGYIMNRKS